MGSHSQSLLFFIVDTSYSCYICSKKILTTNNTTIAGIIYKEQQWIWMGSHDIDELYVPAFLLCIYKHSMVSFCDGTVYDDPLLRPLSGRTKHSRLLVRHCRNSSVLSLLSALPALLKCAYVSYFSILVQFF